MVPNPSELEQRILQTSLKSKWPFLKSLERNTVHASLEARDDKVIPIGTSKLGGEPDLPAGQEWPATLEGEPLAFVGQVDFAAAAPHDRDGLLPESGSASFFYSLDQDGWGFDPKADADKFKVLFFPATTRLERRKTPEYLIEEGLHPACVLTFGAATSLPDYSDQRLETELSEDELDTYQETTDPGRRTKLLGYADQIQDEMELECALVSHGINCGSADGYNDPRRPAIEKEKSDWILLLQVDSEDEAELHWGDCGRLYFWIRKQDLASLNFDRAWLILQCT